ncbi:hypothetical protein SAY87_002057 [Trapa incisa]|uniref:AB hydrolase-1 domain-containing protein n=1 Tax=Trapa incisa TaxID=236973 RepID=A0AAN7JZ36_9MYRT|nr:hypothetical protein SAY87_002057 [Trapa incisa]
MVAHSKPLAASMNAKILGSGPTTVVLAHGFGGNQSVWDKIVPPLVQSNYQVLLFDWAFSGSVEAVHSLHDPVRHASYDGFASDLVKLLEEMMVKSVALVGHSMSGMIGCLASIKRPDLFQRLVLLCASPRYVNTDDFQGGFEDSDVENLISSIESDYAAWATGFSGLVVDPNHPASADKFCKCLLQMRPEVALPLAKTVFYSDHREILRDVPVPCHIVHATKDIVVPNSVALYMQAQIGAGKSTLEMMEIEGHFPQMTAPGQLIAVLRRLLAGASDSAAVGHIGVGARCAVEL